MAKNKKRRINAPKNKNKDTHRSLKPGVSAASLPARKPEPTIPFHAEDRILLVGEGDLSFAKSIVEHHGCCDVTATCFDVGDALLEKYKPQAEEHVTFLETEGQTVMYGVDATKLDSIKTLRNGSLFGRVIFNFPHIGGRSKDVNRQVRFNQELLVKFFGAAVNLLASSGTIIVTLFEGEPYTLWNIRDLARHSGLEVQRSFKFMAQAYPGYSHARTLGNIEGGGGWKGEDRDARSYVFQKKGAQQATGAGKSSKKRSRDADSSEDEA